MRCAAFDFLRPEIIEALVIADVSTDVQFALVNANHFDDCNFSGGSQVIASNQAEAVRNLDQSLPESAEAAALLYFGRALHTVQDFYAHSNWVELGGKTLFDRATLAGRTQQHLDAKALATAQSRHEWCRPASLARAAWG